MKKIIITALGVCLICVLIGTNTAQINDKVTNHLLVAANNIQNTYEEVFGGNFTFETIEGATITRESLEGHVVVFFCWSSLAMGNMEEIPIINGLADEFAEQEVKFVAISNDSKTAITKYLESKNLSIHGDVVASRNDVIEKIALLKDDEWNNGPLKNFTVMPLYLAVDKAGKIIFYQKGVHDKKVDHQGQYTQEFDVLDTDLYFAISDAL